jgi:predicted dehydrogenase
MKQVIQSFKTGQTRVADVPPPSLRSQGILVRTGASLVSAGTERMVVNFAEKNVVQKAQARPDLVRQVIEKVRTDGLLTTLDSVRNRMDQPLPLGYSSAGIVLQAGNEALNFQPGERVACAGGGFAGHAEVAYVPRTLAVKLPDTVLLEEGCFATIGAIALQGIRQSEVVLGCNVAVIGLGLLGQLTVQMLKAAGCRVFGVDTDPQRVALAEKSGADAAHVNDLAVAEGQSFTSNRDFDAILITADTESHGPVHLAGQLARSRAIVVAVGAVGMQIDRKLYYEKELDFRLSRSYGPGRYDPDYEEKGNDYPYPYVRWTEQRNMEAFVQLVAEDKLHLGHLITHRFPIEQANEAYDLITGKTREPFLGVVLTYGENRSFPQIVEVAPEHDRNPRSDPVKIGVLGAGNFANATLLPVLKKIRGLELVAIASAGGLTARGAAERFGFRYCATDPDEILRDDRINTVAVLTRHDLHGQQVMAALKAGKHVYVEKPLCLTNDELDAIVQAYEQAAELPNPPALLVGYNRRFAPFVMELREHLRNVIEPLMINYRINAGFIPPNHWVHDLTVGGGRLLGEGCHFVDLAIFLAGSQPQQVTTRALPDAGRYAQDNFLITIEFANGSIAAITYLANGDKAFGKELLEVFGGGLSARLDNFRNLTIRRGSTKIVRKAWLRQDKGYKAEWEAFLKHLTGKAPAPISWTEIIRSTEATFAAWRSLTTGAPVLLNPERSEIASPIPAS